MIFFCHNFFFSVVAGTIVVAVFVMLVIVIYVDVSVPVVISVANGYCHCRNSVVKNLRTVITVNIVAFS